MYSFLEIFLSLLRFSVFFSVGQILELRGLQMGSPQHNRSLSTWASLFNARVPGLFLVGTEMEGPSLSSGAVARLERTSATGGIPQR